MEEKKDKIEITVKVNGKSVPLSSVSDETLSKIKRQQDLDEDEKYAPVFYVCGSPGMNRLIVKMTPCVISTMKTAIGLIDSGVIDVGTYISFEPGGTIGTYNVGRTVREVKSFYRCGIIKPLF